MVIKSKPQILILRTALCEYIGKLREEKFRAVDNHFDKVRIEEKYAHEMLMQALIELNQIDEEENA